ncbi:MAG: hypothetical protein JW789_02235 [Candidatus Aenigmarchaeota archaeon]|nr:hypothetical protein [Candidatus Aenigmarchaeota archaeon]
MKKFLPVALVLVVFSSGCTIPGLDGINIPFLTGGQVVQYEHDVIVIKSLEAVPSEIDAGQSTKIIAYVQNIGDRTIPIQGVQNTQNGIIVELYDYCKGLFSIASTSCKGVASNGVCTIDNILPGEIVPVTWTIEQNRNSDISLKTVCPQDGMKVLVKYPYKTNALADVSFVSKEELERSIEQRDYLAVGDYLVTGQGPLKPYITIEDKQPIPVFTGARTVLGFQFKNMGQGYATEIKAPEISGLDGIGTYAGECEIATMSGLQSVTIIGKESPKYLCKLEISNMNFERRATRVVEASIEYMYTFTKNVQVTVNPKIAI